MEGPIRNRAQKAVAATRSGLRRYPRELLASVREARQARLDRLVERGVGSQTDLARFIAGDLAAIWIGHATVLMRLHGLTVLTDPVFSERIGMSVGDVTFGLQRLAPPAIRLEDLPQIDIVLLSHAHFDHLDKPTLRRLAQRAGRGATVVTAERTRRLVPAGFREVVELPWGAEIRHKGVTLSALRPRHWGARTALDRYRRYNAYVLDSPGRRALFAGDTALTDAFDRVRGVDISAFGIGAYEPWDHAHANPEQVWQMFSSAGGRGGHLLPMHHSTFDLGQEQRHEPLERLLAAAGDQADRVVCREPGELWLKTRAPEGEGSAGQEPCRTGSVVGAAAR